MAITWLLVRVWLVVFFKASAAASNVVMPPGWDVFCTSDREFVDRNLTTLSQAEVLTMTQISCRLSASEAVLDFRDLRKWTETIPNKVAVEILCSNNATFISPWPMKARNVVFLRIKQCVLEKYFAEYFDKTLANIPYDLRVLELRSSIILIYFTEISDVFANYHNIIKDAYCGPVSAEVLGLTGTEFRLGGEDFLGSFYESSLDDLYDSDLNDTQEILNDDFEDHIEDFDGMLDEWIKTILGIPAEAEIFHECRYNNLRVLDESSTKSLTNYHIDLIKMDSVFPELMVYNLSRTNLDSVPALLHEWRSLIHFPKLQHLDLSHNKISDFMFKDNGPKVPNPGVIDLRYNNIKELSRAKLESLVNMPGATVLLQENPLSCACINVKQFHEFLEVFNNTLTRYRYLNKLVCASPPKFARREIGSLSIEDICPGELPVELIIICSTLGLLLMLLIIVFFILIRYRRETVILLYTRLPIFWKLLRCCLKQRPLPLKENDVYISTCDSDRKWAQQNVQSFLGNYKRKSFKIWTNDDWEYGVPIADEAIRSVENSVHTVAIISREYIQDEWRQFEFSVALRQSLVEKRRHLVVVFKEDVPKRLLPPDMRKYVSTVPSIDFKSRIFQDRLLYAVSCGDPIDKKAYSTSSENSQNDRSMVTIHL